MAVSPQFQGYVLDQLTGVDAVAKRMFGGLGLFTDGLMFAVVDDDRLFFKVDAEARARHEAAGMGPFEYTPGKQALGYFEVPLDVMEDAAALVEWARGAIAVAERADAAKPPSQRKRAGGAAPAKRKRAGSTKPPARSAKKKRAT